MNQKRLVILLGLAAFIVMADNWVVSPILPAIAAAFHIQAASAGVLIAAYMLPFGIFQLIFGPLADRFGKLRVITVTMTLFTAASALCGIATGLSNLELYRAITGIFAAATVPVSLALIGDLIPLERRQAAIGSFLGIALLGQALSMGIGGTIAYFASWRGVFFIYAGLSAAITILLIITSRHLSGQLAGSNPQGKLFAPYIGLLKSAPSLKAYLTIFAEGVFIFGAFSYLGAYLAHTFKLSYMAIGLIVTLFGIGSVTAGKLSSKVVAVTGRTRLIAIGLFITSLAEFAIAVFSADIAIIGGGIFLLGIGSMLAHSTLIMLATEFAQRARGVAMSLVAFSLMVGGAVGTGIGGRLIPAFGFETFFLVFAAVLLSLSIAIPIALSEEKLAAQVEPLA